MVQRRHCTDEKVFAFRERVFVLSFFLKGMLVARKRFDAIFQAKNMLLMKVSFCRSSNGSGMKVKWITVFAQMLQWL